LRRSSSLPEHLGRLRDRIFEGDNDACYIEREKILREVESEGEHVPPCRRYSFVLARLLSRVSTPIEDDDVLLGRVVEARWDSCASVGDVHRHLMPSKGHLTLDWPTLLSKGLGGVTREAREAAERLGTEEARDFAGNAAVCARAVGDYARSYADSARRRAAQTDRPDVEANLLRAAEALERVPDEPAWDFFSALQSIWLVHLVTSCYVGSRDFAFGHTDRHLLPFYEKGLADGTLDRQAAVALLGHFLMKTNEITGTAAWNYKQKPIPCQHTNQYLMLAGSDAHGNETTNDLTATILEAARLVDLSQPVLTVCMSADSSERLKRLVGEHTPHLHGQIHFYNDAQIRANLRNRGIPEHDACDYTMGGCCRLELEGRNAQNEMWHSLPHWLLAALNGGRPPVPETTYASNGRVAGVPEPEELCSFDDLLAAFRRVCTDQFQRRIEGETQRLERQELPFRFESLLLRDCVERGADYSRGGERYTVRTHFLIGLATVANALLTIKRLVFDDRRLALTELLEITSREFDGHEELRQEILHRVPKFGNDDSEVDRIAAAVAEIALDEFERVPAPKGHIVTAGFYSLDHHHRIGRELPATPDGRVRGQPVNENQSPTYGTDMKGLTALLKSASRLPFGRAIQGGLNVKFSGKIAPDKIAHILETYLRLGGLHLGFSFVDRQTLEDAREYPERHRSLCVRLYGFSYYFVALAPHEQQELIERTEY